MNVTIRQLEVFAAVAERCSFADAASRLGISQPAVSNHVAALEAELGRKLFVRRRGGSPTLALDGVTFLVEAKAFLTALQRFSSTPPSSQRQEVRVYAGSHILECFVKPLLSSFYENNPDLNLVFTTELSFDGVASSLRKRRIDCAIFASPMDHISQDVKVLMHLRSGLYIRSAATGDPGDLRSEGFILPPEGTIESAILTRQIVHAGYNPLSAIFRTQYPAIGVDMARKGPGIAPLLGSMVNAYDPNGTLRKVSDLPSWFLCMSLSPHLPRQIANRVRILFDKVAERAKLIEKV